MKKYFIGIDVPALNLTAKFDIEYYMNLTEYFGCRVNNIFGKREYKGILFSRHSRLFYVFINNFYLKGEHELDRRNFRLDLSRSNIEQAKSVLFSKGSSTRIERQRTRYVKIVNREKMYLTLNPFETHRIVFANGEENGNGQLVATFDNSVLIHKCSDQIFMMSGVAFCIGIIVSVF